jgi:hypothetical protein
LGGRVDGVEGDSDFVFQVATYCVQRKAESLTGFPVLRAVIVMATAYSVGSGGLQGVGTTIDEEAEVIYPYIRWGFQTKR